MERLASGADLSRSNLSSANLVGTEFDKARFNYTTLGDLDLSVAKSLNGVSHWGPSTLGLDSLAKSQNGIPKHFLKQCGLAPWEIHHAGMYDPSLTAADITDLQYKIFDQRTHGPFFIAGVFISYSHADSVFVDKLHRRLTDAGAVVWLDRHDMIAGDMQKQVAWAIRLQDTVLLVLSEESTQSDWVENELDMARIKEREQKRDVLCPVALDDSWKSKLEIDSPNRALWRTLTDKMILDFSKWKTKAFETPFEKLVRGLKKNYPLVPDRERTARQWQITPGDC